MPMSSIVIPLGLRVKRFTHNITNISQGAVVFQTKVTYVSMYVGYLCKYRCMCMYVCTVPVRHTNASAHTLLYTSISIKSVPLTRQVGSILHGVDSLSYFSFQPVLHDWCNKGRGMCYPVCGMVHIKEPVLLASLSEWSLTICLTPYNRR